ncbi:MAG: 5'-methylthioadenosine/S-adenosylhomocysteine nucleosidase [Actinomycetaceae bacterium]|nr:5'-methylthioadenosine/S-adenosylhomocysteine nucleosidase [Arcanobacterium sp.]MDD7505682.1 5'-methylthioadenosine/S-adenosylhomocysteine nucleosidase [Actinomycetaceae bacterium]MDY6143467.1 5'-methylthioadenosine/S-adenosylhomocysteine nucleosidase [Arcanobacterium sp.]
MTSSHLKFAAFQNSALAHARVDTLFISAMPEEMAPMIEMLSDREFAITSVDSPVGSVYFARKDGGSHLASCVTGIGMVDTAQALSLLIAHLDPRAVISIGSAGGLARDSRVGQIVVGTHYVNGGADATVFEYLPGQVPQHPALYAAHAALFEAARQAANDPQFSDITRFGHVLSSDSFITERNVGNYRSVFPDAVSTDMESTSAAQVCATWGVPFISCRAISDLCGDPDDQSVSFHAELSTVAQTSARFALACAGL